MDPTVTELQAQIDRLSHAVQQARETQGRLEPMEQRLSQLVERCAEILERWADADQRHQITATEVEARLGEWSSIEQRLQQDALHRSRVIESTVEQEWEALRQRHEEPIKLLREQAASLGEVCVAAANLSLKGFERAESRFAALERDLHGQLGQLSRDLQATLSELRREVAKPAALGTGVEPFPLEGVMRIHDELRESARPADGAIDVPAPKQIASPVAAAEPAAIFAERLSSIERDISAEREEVRDAATQASRARRDWRWTVAGIAAVVVAAVVLGIFGVRYLNARLDDAAARAVVAERQAQTAADSATRQVQTIRADADRQIAEARQTAQKAEIVSDVLAAPDLVRYFLVGGDPAQPDRPNAQAYWSRTHGFVLSGSRLAAVDGGSVLQIWLQTDAGPVSAGTFTPDAAGHATVALADPPRPPRPVIGVLVTLESSGAQAAPSGATVLARAQQ